MANTNTKNKQIWSRTLCATRPWPWRDPSCTWHNPHPSWPRRQENRCGKPQRTDGTSQSLFFYVKVFVYIHTHLYIYIHYFFYSMIGIRSIFIYLWSYLSIINHLFIYNLSICIYIYIYHLSIIYDNICISYMYV